MKHEPFVIILSSPSGAGKTSITKAILQNDKQLVMSVSVTTRPKRASEVDGVDYFFVSEEEFNKMLEKNELLEYAKVYDYYYGSPKSAVLKNLDQGIDVVFDIDWQGAKQLKNQIADKIISVFILPPSIKELESRLRNRNSDSNEIIKRRLSEAKNDICYWNQYDYVIVNQDLNQSIRLVESIISSERLRRNKIHTFVNKLIKE